MLDAAAVRRTIDGRGETMVRKTDRDSQDGSVPESAESFLERFRAAHALYKLLNELMGDWNERAKSADDATILTVCRFYQGACQDLDLRLKELQLSNISQAFPAELDVLRKAREHMALIRAIDPARVIRSMNDIREGRTITLEQMRRELRNPAV
jgi:hypothetical protein